LSTLFSQYGNIIDIVAKKNLRARGQAFIVFDESSAAEKAIQEIQGFEIYDKPMQLEFAKTRSDATVQRVGSAEELELHKRRRLAEKGAFTRLELTDLAREETSNVRG
jgi:U2 small nuclear ribonucleoprotein B''